MRTCPTCGRESPDDQDFCSCGEYLRWELTGVSDTVAPRPQPASDHSVATWPVVRGRRPSNRTAAARAATAPAQPPAAIILRDPEAEQTAGSMPAVAVEPGQHRRVLALVRNQSGIVDNYTLRVDGLPLEWWSVRPAAVFLVPFGSDGSYESEVELDLHPPRSAQATAGAWPLRVVAVSRAGGRDVATAPLELTIAAFTDIATELRPEHAAGRRGRSFEVLVTNRANAPLRVALEAADSDGELRFAFDESRPEIAPGATAVTRMRARPRRMLWIGRSVERRLQVTTRPSALAARPVLGSFTQRPWLPWWIPPSLAVLAIALAPLLLLAPKSVVVPNVRGLPSTFAAGKVITAAGLKLDPQQSQELSRERRPGTVLDQTPAPGAKAEKGSTVALLVAVGSGRVKVPDIRGLTAAVADSRLRAAELSLGAASPQPIDTAAPIADQIPRPGEAVKAGTAIAVFYGQSGPGGKSAGVVPASSGVTAADLGERLAAVGLVARQRRVVDASPAGTVLRTEPAAGARLAPGGEVAVIVSAGPAELVFTSRDRIVVVDSATGKQRETVGAGADPTWSADGRSIAYVADGRILLRDLEHPGAPPARLTRSGSYQNLAWAPDPSAPVLAMDRVRGGDTDLCLGRVSGDRLHPRCKREPSFRILRAIHWEPGGRALLAVAAKPAGGFGIVRWTTEKPFSDDPAGWSRGRFVTDTSDPDHGVLDAALSPDGERLAVVSDLRGHEFRLFLAAPGDFDLESAEPAQVRACKVGWRPDGQELVVVSSDIGCRDPEGTIVRVPLRNDSGPPVQVAASGNDPAYRP